MIGELQGEFGDSDIKYLKQKNLKMSVANIGKLQENFAAVQDGCEISQHEGHHFAALRNCPSAWSDWLPMAVTPSFQL